MLEWRVAAVVAVKGVGRRTVVLSSKSRMSVLLRVMRDGGQRSMMRAVALRETEVAGRRKGEYGEEEEEEERVCGHLTGYVALRKIHALMEGCTE